MQFISCKFYSLFISITILFIFSCSSNNNSNNKPQEQNRIIKRDWSKVIESEKNPNSELPIVWHRPFSPVIPTKWFLTIDGLVKEIKTFNLGDLEMFPSRRITCTLKSADGWEATKTWEGIHFSDLCKYVKPKPEAKYVYFYCADDYFECVELTDLLAPKVILAYFLDNDFIPTEYGYPLVLVMPDKYSHKWAKSIIKITFESEKKLGTKSIEDINKWTWEGDIQEDNMKTAVHINNNVKIEKE